MLELITAGESMVAFIPYEEGLLRHVQSFTKRLAGAESNVAIGLCRLGHRSGWISRLGDDEFGRFILREMRAEGVELSQVKTESRGPTGLMFKEHSGDSGANVYYYRRNSAASFLCIDDIDSSYIESARILHMTGITPALSESCRHMTRHCMETAKAKGLKISFDPNIRIKLWSKTEAVKTLSELMYYVDILIMGEEEGELLFNATGTDELMEKALGKGIGTVVIKQGDRGIWVVDAGQQIFIPPFEVGNVVDTVGAGDAYNAGFLAGVLEGRSLRDCGIMGSAAGALAVTVQGDFEAMPDRNGLGRYIMGNKPIER